MTIVPIYITLWTIYSVEFVMAKSCGIQHFHKVFCVLRWMIEVVVDGSPILFWRELRNLLGECKLGGSVFRNTFSSVGFVTEVLCYSCYTTEQHFSTPSACRQHCSLKTNVWKNTSNTHMSTNVEQLLCRQHSSLENAEQIKTALEWWDHNTSSQRFI